MGRLRSLATRRRLGAQRSMPATKAGPPRAWAAPKGSRLHLPPRGPEGPPRHPGYKRIPWTPPGPSLGCSDHSKQITWIPRSRQDARRGEQPGRRLVMTSRTGSRDSCLRPSRGPSGGRGDGEEEEEAGPEGQTRAWQSPAAAESSPEATGSPPASRALRGAAPRRERTWKASRLLGGGPFWVQKPKEESGSDVVVKTSRARGPVVNLWPQMERPISLLAVGAGREALRSHPVGLGPPSPGPARRG